MDKISIGLVKDRLNQAKEKIKAAYVLYNAKLYKDANNRAYYSIFYSIRAVLALEPKDFKKHSSVIAYFNKNYVSTEIFPKKIGRKINQANIVRDSSDYNDFYIASEEQALDQIKSAEEIYKYTIDYIDKWCNENKIKFDKKDFVLDIINPS